ncbi:hypothetical protein SVIOM342S_05977 [Streptomyces violaceorubidus]
MSGGGEHAVALGVRDDREDGQRGVGGGLLGGPVGEVVHLVQRVGAAALGEPGHHQVVRVVVVGVPAAHLVEDTDDVLVRAQGALQHEEPEPGRGIVRHQGGGVPAHLADPGGLLPAPQGPVDQGEGEQHRGVGGVGFGQQPLAGPGGAVGLLGEHRHPVSPAVPVVTRVDQQGADGLPAPLSQRGACGGQFGVVEGFVEGLGRAFAAAAEGRRGWGHRGKLPHATRQVVVAGLP